MTQVPQTLEVISSELLKLRRAREKRDNFAYSQSLLDASKILESRFMSWADQEVRELLHITDLLLTLTDGQANERLSKIRTELSEIKSRKLPEANENLGHFADKMKEKRFTRTSDVVHSIVDDLGPSISLIEDLIDMRSDVDSLGDMILAVSGMVEEITDEEKADLEKSREDLAAGKTFLSSDSDEIIHYLNSE